MTGQVGQLSLLCLDSFSHTHGVMFRECFGTVIHVPVVITKLDFDRFNEARDAQEERLCTRVFVSWRR